MEGLVTILNKHNSTNRRNNIALFTDLQWLPHLLILITRTVVVLQCTVAIISAIQDMLIYLITVVDLLCIIILSVVAEVVLQGRAVM